MSLLAQTIGQIFEIEFCHILPFWAFFTLKSDSTYPRFKFSDLVLYWAYDRGPKNFGLMGSYIWIPYSKCDQGGLRATSIVGEKLQDIVAQVDLFSPK